MKKVLAILLALVMVLSMAACASKSAPDQAETPAENQNNTPASDNTSSGDTAEAPAEDAPAGDPVYIAENAAEMTGSVRLLTAFKGGLGTDALIEAFHEYYPNIEVTYDIYTNNAEGNMLANTSIQSGNVDVILSFGTHNTAFRWENAMLADITDRLAADNLDLVKEWGTDAYKYNDRIYCFPSGGLSIFVAVNMTAWEEAGLGELPDSWTWDEYLDACRAMTKTAADGSTEVYGGCDFNQRDYWTYSMRQTKGVDAFYTSDGQADFTSGLAAKILNRELDAEAEGILFPKINLITGEQKSRDLLWSGTVATCVESIITRFVMDTENYPHDFLLGYAPYPVNEAGETNYALGNMPNSFYCVTSNCQDEDAAYAFAKFASTYGGKYLYKAGHTTTWTGVDPNEIVSLVFGDEETAAKFVDVDSYVKNVLAIGQPAYHEEFITGYSEIASYLDEYTDYILSGQMSVEDGLQELNDYANQAIQEAQ